MDRKNLTLLTVALATFMTYLDNNIVNVALPRIQVDLGLTVSGLEWVVSAYILVFASLLLAGGRLADLWGRRRVLLVGLAVFTGSSLVAGLAGSSAVLIGARAAQGLGAALVAPTSLAIISATFPGARERARAVGIWGGVGAVALALGPLLGGLLSEHATWGWIFFVNVPVGIVAALLTFSVVDESRAERAERFDVPGVVLSTAALFFLTYALIEGATLGWTSAAILGSFAAAAALASGFAVVELRSAEPMVRLDLFRSRVLSGGVVAVMMWAFGLFGIYFFTALYLQDVLGFSPTEAGAAFVPMAVLMAVGAVLSDRAAHRWGAHRTVGLAMLAMAAGIASFLAFGDQAGWLQLTPSLMLIGAGGGLTMSLTASVLHAMPPDRAGVASGVFNGAREVAGLLGVTVIGAVLLARQDALLRSGSSPLEAYVGGYHAGLVVAAVLVAAGGVTAYLALRRPTAPVPLPDDPRELVAA